jgi:hypothetical protein
MECGILSGKLGDSENGNYTEEVDYSLILTVWVGEEMVVKDVQVGLAGLRGMVWSLIADCETLVAGELLGLQPGKSGRGF